jgi:predicted SAM-dependent methyltransferase
MSITERVNELNRQGQPVRIELGCGPSKLPGYIGIDSLPLDGVDHVANLEEGLAFLPDNSVDEMTSSHFLEHIENFEGLMREIHRVLKPTGIKRITVPHFSNPWYYSDHTHKKFFGLYTFDYFAKETTMARKVPRFYHDFHFVVVKRKIVFKSPHTTLRNLRKQVYNRLFNVNSYMQEYYEECLCYRFPCQEMQYILQPIKK